VKVYSGNKDGRIVFTSKTNVFHNTINPHWDYHEYSPIYHHNRELLFVFELWDSDTFTADDFLGQYEVAVTPEWHEWNKTKTESLQTRSGFRDHVKGDITFKLTYTKDDFSHTQVSYKYHSHTFTGLARALSAGEEARSYATYQISLHHVQDIFKDDERKKWNEKYDAAIKIFNSPVIRTTIVTQHNHLYSEVSVSKFGKLNGSTDLLLLLNHGIIGGKPRYFTYAITGNTWFFSETGAAFFVDFTSKHAMHACAQEYVYYAGEFAIIPDQHGKNFRLCIDNNSGTYGPKKEYLSKLRLLFQLNFPGLHVEVNDYHEPSLKKYKSYIESGKLEFE